jgi:hypothetical protein
VGAKELAAVVANRSLGRSRDAKDSRALAVLSQVVGAVILARAVSDREFASRILGSAKTHLLSSEDSALKRCAEGRRATTYLERRRQSRSLK